MCACKIGTCEVCTPAICLLIWLLICCLHGCVHGWVAGDACRVMHTRALVSKDKKRALVSKDKKRALVSKDKTRALVLVFHSVCHKSSCACVSHELLCASEEARIGTKMK